MIYTSGKCHIAEQETENCVKNVQVQLVHLSQIMLGKLQNLEDNPNHSIIPIWMFCLNTEFVLKINIKRLWRTVQVQCMKFKISQDQENYNITLFIIF